MIKNKTARLLVVAYGLCAAAVATAVPMTFIVDLAGSNEVPQPPATTAGDPDGTGTATFTIYENNTINWEIVTSNIDTPNAGHIHVGPTNTNGPVKFAFGDPFQLMGTGVALGQNDSLRNAILANPGNYYVNIHNAAFPGGAIRGQLGTPISGGPDGGPGNPVPDSLGFAWLPLVILSLFFVRKKILPARL